MTTLPYLQRSLYLGILIFVGVFISQTAFAAEGSITIEQYTEGTALGTWILTRPDAKQVLSKNFEEERHVPNAPAGSYTLFVKPPKGSLPTIELYRGGSLEKSANDDSLSFGLTTDGESLRLVVSYRYNGTIVVDSTNVRGVSFELKGAPGLRRTGTTPTTFTGLPPLSYTVYFKSVEGCATPKPQNRTLLENGTLTLMGYFMCGTVESPEEEEEETEASESTEEGPVHISVWQSSKVQEALPGGTVHLTIGVRNASEHDLQNITISEIFDPAQAQVMGTLPKDGAIGTSDAHWTIPELKAGQSWIADFSITLSKDLSEGQKVTLTARASGDDLDTVDTGSLTSAVTMGIAALPQTGISFDILFIAFGAAVSFLLTSLIRRRRRVCTITV